MNISNGLTPGEMSPYPTSKKDMTVKISVQGMQVFEDRLEKSQDRIVDSGSEGNIGHGGPVLVRRI